MTDWPHSAQARTSENKFLPKQHPLEAANNHNDQQHERPEQPAKIAPPIRTRLDGAQALRGGADADVGRLNVAPNVVQHRILGPDLGVDDVRDVAHAAHARRQAVEVDVLGGPGLALRFEGRRRRCRRRRDRRVGGRRALGEEFVARGGHFGGGGGDGGEVGVLRLGFVAWIRGDVCRLVEKDECNAALGLDCDARRGTILRRSKVGLEARKTDGAEGGM